MEEFTGQMAPDLKKDTFCFVCGGENPHGLHLKIERDGKNGVKSRFVALERYKGWSDFLHAGMISLVFDELLGWLSLHAGYDAMTARLEIRYRKPVPLGTTVHFKAQLERAVKGLLDIHLSACMEDGSVAAEGTGRMMILNRRE